LKFLNREVNRENEAYQGVNKQYPTTGLVEKSDGEGRNQSLVLVAKPVLEKKCRGPGKEA
jgi:hypothetical protein